MRAALIALGFLLAALLTVHQFQKLQAERRETLQEVEALSLSLHTLERELTRRDTLLTERQTAQEVLQHEHNTAKQAVSRALTGAADKWGAALVPAEFVGLF